ncbi:hypothetical protein E2K98_07275 [Bacillus salipaludis]|uniref:Uncharacterized protein n=1 Tax=Bacillus salipaludis TaxID=2547811 RepID=A0A4R5VXS2_9BACI|nr:hypothetical protein [Bacillus salipaludis]TDK63242.1 hypothetical protein E2K98_07275 [Bacillus salipaludis]
MKNKLFVLILGLFLAVPGLASAHKHIPVDHEGHDIHKEDCCDKDNHRHHFMHGDWKAKMAAREGKILGWVNQYTPEKKEAWTKMFSEKKVLMMKWLSPQNAAKREQWKKERMEKMEKFRKQYDEGKITKEEFLKKVHGGKDMSHWQTYHEIEEAVAEKNNEEAKKYLNQLLEQYKAHNQMLKDLMAK